METFEEYQTLATKTPLSLRNNRDRINLPVAGLQTEAGKIGSVLEQAFASGNSKPAPEHVVKLKASLADILWFIALICDETGISMADVAAQSLAQLRAREVGRNPEQR